MKFRTDYKAVPSPLRLSPERPVALIGSCFSDNMATKMRECGWDAFSDAGTLYNPLSIAEVIELLVFDPDFRSTLERTLFQTDDGIVHSWLFDTHFSRNSPEDVIDNIEKCRETLLGTLRRAETLIVTFGTSWCYFLTEGDRRLVANCHKMPQSMFERRRLSVEEISQVWRAVCEKLTSRFPGLSVIFTVSPVRHLKDGFEGNARSKATLLLAVEEICRRMPQCHYFPAFEIVCDDLRDYRFYDRDLVHPSDTAVEYIWEIFRRTYLDEEGERLLKEGNRRFKALNHRPIFHSK